MIKVSFVKALFMLWSKNLCLGLYMQSWGREEYTKVENVSYLHIFDIYK